MMTTDNVGKIVREVNWAGPCIDRGPIIRETVQFYVYGYKGSEKRVKKCASGYPVHIEPCNRCVDHPQTEYPNGYDA